MTKLSFTKHTQRLRHAVGESHSGTAFSRCRRGVRVVPPAVSLPEKRCIYLGAHLVVRTAGRPVFSGRTGITGYPKLLERLYECGMTAVQGVVQTMMQAPTLPSRVYTSVHLGDPVCIRAGGRPLRLSEPDPTRSSIEKGTAKYLNGIYRLHMHLRILNLLIKWSSIFFSATQRGFLRLSWKFLTYSMNLVFTLSFLIFSCILSLVDFDGFCISVSQVLDIRVCFSSGLYRSLFS